MSGRIAHHCKPQIRRCMVCGKLTEDDAFCSRACAIERQRIVFGATIRALANAERKARAEHIPQEAQS